MRRISVKIRSFHLNSVVIIPYILINFIFDEVIEYSEGTIIPVDAGLRAF